jgi:5'-nucleotidase
MKILITNDDGIDAPGLTTLHDVAARLGEVRIIAPHVPHSGCSHRVTTDSPITIREMAAGRSTVAGTPVDCVRIALLWHAAEVDWVLSGINDGGNLGVDIYMSGTVGAAREAALLGKRAIAISQYRRRPLPFDWSWAGRFVEHLLPMLMRRPLPPRCFWNVNLPHEPDYSNASPEIVFCPVDPHPLPVHYEQIDGALHYRSDYHARRRKLGSDVDVCFGGRIAVSIVPLDSA